MAEIISSDKKTPVSFPEPNKKSGSKLVLIVVLILIFILSFAGAFAYQKYYPFNLF